MTPRERAEALVKQYIEKTYDTNTWAYFYRAFLPLTDLIESALKAERGEEVEAILTMVRKENRINPNDAYDWLLHWLDARAEEWRR